MSIRGRLSAPDVALWARVEWRSRWRTYLLLSGVVAVTVGVLLAALTAANRSETAFARLRATTRATNMTVFFGDSLLADPSAAVAAIEGLDGVDLATLEMQPLVIPAGTDYRFYFRNYARVDHPGGVNSPVIIAGRALDPENPNEVVLSESLASDLGVGVGDSLPLQTATSAWSDNVDPGPPDGPTVNAIVVGIGRSPIDFGRFAGVIHVSPAFVKAYRGDVHFEAKVEARISADAQQRLFERYQAGKSTALAGLGPDAQPFGMQPSPFGESDATATALGTIADALRLVGATAALAGAAAAAIVLLRIVGVAMSERATYAALGWTRRRHARAVSSAVIPWMGSGILLGLALGTWLSPLLITSLARKIDITSDAIVVKVGLTLVVGVLVLLASGLAVAAAVGIAFSARDHRRTTRIYAIGLLQPLPVSLGIRQALFGQAERGGRASRGALAAVTLAVVGAVAALAVSASIARLQSEPELSGMGMKRVIGLPDPKAVDDASALLLANEAVSAVAEVYISESVHADGFSGFNSLLYDVKRGELPLTVLRGRVAQSADEVAFGPVTLQSIGKNVGDVVTLAGVTDNNGVETSVEGKYRIVGEVLFPEGDFSHDEGAALTVAAANPLFGVAGAKQASFVKQVTFDWSEAADGVAGDASLRAANLEVFDYRRLIAPSVVTNLGRIAALPRLLAVFLGTLAFISLAHALTVSVRLRSRELATLRALGMTSRSSAGIFSAHSYVLVVVALLIGVPIGYAVGGQIWRPIANRANVVVSIALPWEWIGSLCVVALVAATLVAIVSGWRVRRLRPAPLLRSG